MVLRALAGIGLIGGSMGCVALLLLALNGAVKMLGNYARLHYRLLKPEQHAAGGRPIGVRMEKPHDV